MTRHFLLCSASCLLLLLLLASSGDAFTTRSSSAVFRRPSVVATTVNHAALHGSQRQSTSFLQYQSNATSDAVDLQQQLSVLTTTAEDDDNNLHDDVTTMATTPSTTSILLAGDNDDKEPMSDVTKARLLLFGAAALYGTNFSLVKILGETGMSVGVSSTLRFGMAALATLPWLLKVDEENKHVRFQTLFDRNSTEFRAAMGGLEVGMWNAIGYVAQAVGLETTSASKSAFLCSLAVVIVPILDYLAGKTLLSRQVVGAALAVIGVGFLELEGVSLTGADGGLMQSLSAGDIASLVQPVAFGLGFWRMEAAMGKHPEEADRATAAQLLAVFLGSTAYMGVMSQVDPASIPSMDQFVTWVTDPVILGALFWTGVITTALTIYMETLALKTLSAAETTLIFSTEPLWGTAFASVVMGETLGINAVFGAVMILSGCVFSNFDMKGFNLASFLPFQNDDSNDDAIVVEQDLFPQEQQQFEWRGDELPANENILPAQPFGKFSLKTGVAGALTGIVVAVEGASAGAGLPPTIVPEELKEFIENLTQ